MGKIEQDINFSSVSQNNDLRLKLNHTHQHESRGMLGFKNRASDIKLLKLYVNRNNNAYLEKSNFQ